MATGVTAGRHRGRRLMPGLLGVGLLGMVVAVMGLAVSHRGLTGQLVLEGTAAGNAPAVVTAIAADQSGHSFRIDPPARRLSVAPAPTDLGVYTVPAATYTRLTIQLGAHTVVVPVALRVPPNGLTPLLVAVRGNGAIAYAGNEGVNLGLQLAGGRLTAMPDITVTDQTGRARALSEVRGGRITVMTSFFTHCHETCPLSTAILADLQRKLDSRGWGQRVTILQLTLDPGRDSPAALAAYAAMARAGWPLLTAAPDALRSVWEALHVSYADVPYAVPAPLDWETGKPEAYDVRHDTVAAVFDAAGYPRFILQGQPRLGHAVSPPLAALLTGDTVAAAQRGDWTLTDLLDRIDLLAGLPSESARAPETAFNSGAPAPPFTLVALDGARVSLAGQRGRPVLLNFWATWCVPCRRELPLLADVARTHPGLRLLAVDEGEERTDVRGFLAGVVGDTPPLLVLLDGDTAVGDRYSVVGLPATVAVDAAGAVRWVHVGEMNTALVAQALAAVGVS